MAGSDALTRVVLADAGPLIALSRADQLSLLRGLFGQVEITDQIRAEVLESGAFPGQVAIDEALREGWLRCHTIELTAWRPLCPGVDAGEASALLLAMQHQAPLLIMDDRAGRAEARARSLSVMGVAAVVGLAKQQGLISAAAPILARMRANGYFIGHDVIAAVLARIGESAVPTPPGP